MMMKKRSDYVHVCRSAALSAPSGSNKRTKLRDSFVKMQTSDVLRWPLADEHPRDAKLACFRWADFGHAQHGGGLKQKQCAVQLRLRRTPLAGPLLFILSRGKVDIFLFKLKLKCR